ncbi:hypothetical protein HMPREF1589_01399 [Escherichia coli 113290]|nr:hypothetical protein HMPREF1589_01399 [Escherichia coli 113290]
MSVPKLLNRDINFLCCGEAAGKRRASAYQQLRKISSEAGRDSQSGGARVVKCLACIFDRVQL